MIVQGHQSSVDKIMAEPLKNTVAVSYFIALGPDPPSDLLIFGQEENTIYLSWKFPQGGFEKFQVKNSAAVIKP